MIFDRLRTDDRGAITVVGMAAGCFLAGCMGTMAGIGRAVMMHDKLQEAADSMASAGSIVHARGMNLIGTINLVMLALVAVFIIMSVIVDIVQVGLLAVIACASTGYTTAVCSPVVSPAKSAHSTAENVRDSYKRVMEPTLTAMSYVQTGIAYVMPYAAQVASIRTAFKYEQVGISFSPSLIPGGGLSLGVNVTAPSFAGFGVGGSSGSKKLGLPVAKEKMGKLCEMAGAYAANWLEKSLGKIKGIALVLKLPGLQQIIDEAISEFAHGIRKRYCSGGYWEKDGPKQMFDSAKNGNDWMQSWSFVFNKKKTDPHEPLVSLGTYSHVLTQGAKVDMPDFFTQAEMFFDCDGKWDAPTCNGPKGKKAYDYAIYGLKWKNRLRRFHPPSFGDLMGQYMQQYLGSGQWSQYMGGSIRDVPAFQGFQSWAGSFGGAMGQAASNQAFDWLAGQADSQIDKYRSKLVGKINGGGNGPTSLILH